MIGIPNYQEKNAYGLAGEAYKAFEDFTTKTGKSHSPKELLNNN